MLEVSEEHDELVRAAEELGIELSRLAARDAALPEAQDAEEGNDRPTPTASSRCAADERPSTSTPSWRT